MERSDRQLVARARRVYELSRLRRAAWTSLWALPMGIAALVAGTTCLTGGLGAILYGLSVAFRWRGEAYGRAVGTGLAAGAIGWIAPLMTHMSGHHCGAGVCAPKCLALCLTGGLIAGCMIGTRAAVQQEGRGSFLLAAATLAAIGGALGCIAIGTGAVVGMLAGVMLASTPFLIASRRANAP